MGTPFFFSKRIVFLKKAIEKPAVIAKYKIVYVMFLFKQTLCMSDVKITATKYFTKWSITIGYDHVVKPLIINKNIVVLAYQLWM